MGHRDQCVAPAGFGGEMHCAPLQTLHPTSWSKSGHCLGLNASVDLLQGQEDSLPVVDTEKDSTNDIYSTKPIVATH